MGRLSGKVAVITGGGQGIGFAVAQTFLDEGCSVVITGRTQEKLDSAASKLSKDGGKVAIYCGDVRKRSDAQAAITLAVEQFGRLDILVNNANSSPIGVPFEDMDDEGMAMTWESGVMASIYHMQAAFPHLKENGGSIINVGSGWSITGKGVAIYAAAKEGIRALSRVAAREWGKHKIRVNVICPAAFSEGVEQYFIDFPGEEERTYKDIPMGHLGDPQGELAPGFLFLASDDSRYVTGQTINVDGGMTML